MNYLFRSFLLVLLLSAGFCSFGQNVKITNYTKDDGLADNDVVALTTDILDNVWLGTRSGAECKYDGEIWSIQGNPSTWIKSACVDENNSVLFIAYDGVFKYIGNTYYHFETKDMVNLIMAECGTVDNNNNYWIGGRGGVSIYHDQKWSSFNY